MTTLVRALFGATLLLSAGLALAQPIFTETFDTTTWESPLSEAVWDTVASEMRMAPHAATVRFTADTPGSGYAVTLYGHYALVADGKSGVTVVDVKWPTSPNTVTTLDTPGFVWESRIHGHYAYLAAQNGGVQVVDLTNPAVPLLAGSLATSSSVYGLAVMGDFLLAGAGSDLLVLDISNPVSPVLAGSLATPGAGARKIALAGDIAYVTDGNGGLAVVDVSDPWAPVLVTSYASPGFVRDIEVRGDVAYVLSSGSGLELVDVSDPATPTLLATYPVVLSMWGLDVAGDRAFLAGDALGLYVLDVSDPTAPALIERVVTPGNAYDVVLADHYALVADKTAGLTTVEVSQRIAPLERGTVPGAARGRLALHGDYGFTADYAYNKIHVLDLTDPVAPVEVASVFHPRPNVAAVHGDVLLVGSGSSLTLFDITDPTSPVSVGGVAMPNDVVNIALSGDVAYAQTWDDVQIVDITDPVLPVVMTGVGPLGLDDVAVRGDHLLIAEDNLLHVYDVTNPAVPTAVTTYAAGASIFRIVPAGPYVYLATSTDLEVVDFASPAAPTFAGRSPGDGGTDLVLAGDRAFVMRGSALLEISLQYPTSPWRWDSINLGTNATFLARRDELIYATTTSASPRVIQVRQSEVDLGTRFGQSEIFHSGTDEVLRVRFSHVQQGRVDWFLQTNGVANIDPIVPGDWQAIGAGATQLNWYAELGYSPGNASPVDQVSVEWLYAYPLVTAVDDVPNDQGRQVSLHWVRSGHDFVGDATQIVEYAVYREIDPALGSGAKAALVLPTGASSALRSDATAKLAAGWHFVTTVPVRVEDNYAVVVPTLADSTAAGPYTSTFMVSALTATPGVYHDSPPFGGQSVDNLAPGVPLGLMASYTSGGVALSWEEAPESDLQYFRVYRGTEPDFTPSPANFVAATAGTVWTDPGDSPWGRFYKLTAVDFSGNESEVAVVDQASDVPRTGTATVLHPAAPNPFNPSTTLRFSLARAGTVRLEVCDVSGRVVRRLVDGHREGGPQGVAWDGRDERGRPVASGVYFSRLTTRDGSLTGRLVLVK